MINLGNMPSIHIDDKVWIALIMTIPAIINAISNFKVATGLKKNHDAVKETKDAVMETKTAVCDTKTAVDNIEKQTNSLTDKLVQTTGESERAKGVQEGKLMERAKQEVIDGAKQQVKKPAK